jgi:hypothetical protein
MARLRLNINLTTGKVEKQAVNRTVGDRFANTIIKDVGLKYADGRFAELSKIVRSEIQQDVLREIEAVARQYAAIIIGSPTSGRNPTLRSSLEGGPQIALPSRRWAPLSAGYSAWKASKGVAPPQHFLLGGTLSREIRKSSTWTEIFGPVAVRVRRTGDGDESRLTVDRSNGSRSAKFSIAQIEVSALGRITPQMIPALSGGALAFSGNGHQTGLMGLVYNHEPWLEYRLGGAEGHVPYRATLEPFLAFLLTRSIPATVQRRISALISPAADGPEHRVKKLR